MYLPQHHGQTRVGNCSDLAATSRVESPHLYVVLYLISTGFQIHNANVRTDRIASIVAVLATALIGLGTPTTSAQATTSYQVPAISGFPKPGSLVATVYIPRLRSRVWGKQVVEDTSPAQLAKGFGHYQGTAMPGKVGNFAIAAHRRGPMSPLYDIDQLRKGDKVIVHQAKTWYIYTLTTSMIVRPSAIWVISPQPHNVIKAGATARPILTLQTCTPATTSTHRWIWWGVLSKVSTGTRIPALR